MFNTLRLFVIFTLAASLGGDVVCCYHDIQTCPIYILPLGDSITQGGRVGRQEYTYRYPLFCLLKKAGISFDFLGSRQHGLEQDALWPSYCLGHRFDLNHEGHYGWKTAQIRDHLSQWLRYYPSSPDMALIHLGTNDQRAKDYTVAIIQPLTDIITLLRKKNPHAIIFIGHLNFNGKAALKIRALIEEKIATLNTSYSPIITVHHYKNWIANPREAGTDTFDWAHPNPQGQKKMARNWLRAMQPFLKTLSGKCSEVAFSR